MKIAGANNEKASEIPEPCAAHENNGRGHVGSGKNELLVEMAEVGVGLPSSDTFGDVDVHVVVAFPDRRVVARRCTDVVVEL